MTTDSILKTYQYSLWALSFFITACSAYFHVDGSSAMTAAIGAIIVAAIRAARP